MYSSYQKTPNTLFVQKKQQQQQQIYKDHNIYNKKQFGNMSFSHYRPNPLQTKLEQFKYKNKSIYPISSQSYVQASTVPSISVVPNYPNQIQFRKPTINYLNSNSTNFNSYAQNGNSYNSNSNFQNNAKSIFISSKSPKPQLGNDWIFQPNKEYDLTRVTQPVITSKQPKIITIQNQEPLVQTVNHANWNQFYENQQQQIEAPPQIPNKTQIKKTCNNGLLTLLGILCLGLLIAGLIIFLNNKNQQVEVNKASKISTTEAKYDNSTTIQNSSLLNSNQSNSYTINKNISSQINPKINVSKTIEPQGIPSKIIQPLQTQPLLVTSQISPLLVKPELRREQRQQIIGSKLVYLTNSQYNNMNQYANTITPISANGYETQPLYVPATPMAYSSNKVSYQIPKQSHLKNHFLKRKYAK